VKGYSTMKLKGYRLRLKYGYFTIFFENEGIHREDGGPAVINEDGYRAWLKSGVYHRVEGPAAIESNGAEFYYVDGEFKRVEGAT